MFEVGKIRQDFPFLMKAEQAVPQLVYLDNAATTLKPQVVIDAVVHYYTDVSVNIHRGDYALSYEVSNAYEAVRKTVSTFIQCEVNEVVFTSGASAALNLVAYGYAEKVLKPNDVILMSEAEHASNVLPWFRVAEKTGAKIEYIQLDEQGVLTIDRFKQSLHANVKIVTLAHISNVLGTIIPINEITALTHAIGAVIVVDGAQSVPHTKTMVKDWDVDFLAFAGHKMLGPTGVGVLYGKFELLKQMDPFLLGGGSNARFDKNGHVVLKNPPFKFEAGTPAIEGVLGLDAAIKYLEAIGFEAIEQHELKLKRYTVEQLKAFKHIKLYNADAQSGIVAFNVEGIPTQDVAAYLSSRGIMVRAGNHCAKLLSEIIHTHETVRASINFYNTQAEMDLLIDALKDITLAKCIDLIF
mgnify:CR=1 FL=1